MFFIITGIDCQIRYSMLENFKTKYLKAMTKCTLELAMLLVMPTDSF